MNTYPLFRKLRIFPLIGLMLGCLAATTALGQDKIKIQSNTGGTLEVAVSDFPVLNEQTRRPANTRSATRRGLLSELMTRPAKNLSGQDQVFFCSTANRVRRKKDGIKAIGGLGCGPNRDSACFWKQPFIRVGFMNGTLESKQIVFEAIAEWTTWANVVFIIADNDKFPDDSADIKIRFKENGSNNSWIGIDSVLPVNRFDPNEATLNLGFLNPPLRYQSGGIIDELRGTILHEFGHALGLLHEHQNPKSGIQWDREAVVKDATGPPNYWEIERIEFNIFRALEEDRIKSTKYDPSSVMHYSFPAKWTLNNVAMERNNELSETDKRFISEAYPRKKLNFESDRYYKLTPVNGLRKLCMSVSKTQTGYVPFLTECNNKSEGQLWMFTPVGDGDYRVTNYLTGKKLSLSDAGLEYDTALQKSGDYNGQKWSITGIGQLKRLSSRSNGFEYSLNAFLGPNKGLAMARTAHWTGQLWEFQRTLPPPKSR